MVVMACRSPISFSMTTAEIWVTKLNMRAAKMKGPRIWKQGYTQRAHLTTRLMATKQCACRTHGYGHG
jgi:hypothetical protein